MLCTQHPSSAAITVTDIVASPADRKNNDAFQHPGNTLGSVANPSTLKFAQCVLPNSRVQRLKIPTVGVYSSVPFSEIPKQKQKRRKTWSRKCYAIRDASRRVEKHEERKKNYLTIFDVIVIYRYRERVQREFRITLKMKRKYLLVSLIVGGPTSHLGVMRPDKTAINAARDKSVHSKLRPVTIT